MKIGHEEVNICIENAKDLRIIKYSKLINDLGFIKFDPAMESKCVTFL